MIDIKLLEKDLDYLNYYRKVLLGRGADVLDLENLLKLNEDRKSFIRTLEENKAYQNKVSEEISVKKRNKQDAAELIEQMQELSQKIKTLQKETTQTDEKVKTLLLSLPNACHSSVPEGTTEEDNEEVKSWGDIENFSFKAKEHFEIGESLGIIDFERGAKVTGARFSFLKGAGAALERALMQFMLDLQTREHGYTEISSPYMVNFQSMTGTGQLPKFAQDSFQIKDFPYFLIPTAEVPVTNYYSGEILSEEQLPLKFVAGTPCFRSEAGAYGRDTKGMIRQHQFLKVELVKFCHPETSYKEHEELTGHAEEVLKRLKLPYRVMSLCRGDISFSAAKCYDIEVWLPGQGSYREISSCSNFEDYQARRANIRFRHGKNKPQFVHTLNGSGLAVGRTLVAVLENYQQEDGSVNVPEVLQPYMGGVKNITRLA